MKLNVLEVWYNAYYDQIVIAEIVHPGRWELFDGKYIWTKPFGEWADPNDAWWIYLGDLE